MINEKNYSDLFKKLVKAYYEDVFQETIDEILSRKEIDKKKFAKVVSALCGVEVSFSKNFSQELKSAIENYKESHRVVINTHSCIKKIVLKSMVKLFAKTLAPPSMLLLLEKMNMV